MALKPSKPAPVSITRRSGDLVDYAGSARSRAFATFGRHMIALLDVLDMTDPQGVTLLMRRLVPATLAPEMAIELAAAAEKAGSAALARKIREALS